MIDFEGNMSKLSRRSMCQVAFEDEDNDMTHLASTITSISAINWEANIDDNASEECTLLPSIEQC